MKCTEIDTEGHDQVFSLESPVQEFEVVVGAAKLFLNSIPSHVDVLNNGLIIGCGLRVQVKLCPNRRLMSWAMGT
jgi:hypothetical protein